MLGHKYSDSANHEQDRVPVLAWAGARAAACGSHFVQAGKRPPLSLNALDAVRVAPRSRSRSWGIFPT